MESFPGTRKGYSAFLAWLASFGEVELLGVEGTGSYGAGLTRHLHAKGVRVVEVDRPNRQRRRRHGKSDPQDAISTAQAAQGGDATGEAKTRDGNVEAMRVLRVPRASAFRPGTKRDLVSINTFTLRMLARRAIELEEEVAEIDAILNELVAETAPALMAMSGVGTDVASALLVAAGDNPERLRIEVSFAHL